MTRATEGALCLLRHVLVDATPASRLFELLVYMYCYDMGCGDEVL